MAYKKFKNYKFHMSIAFCKNCKDIIISPRGGLFVECPCGE